MDKRSNNLIKNTAVLTIGNLCTKGIMFIMTPLFTRWLSQGDYGTFDLLVTYISLIMPAITLDIKEALFRFLLGEEHKNEEKAIITTGIAANMVSFVICIVVSLVLYLVTKSQKLLFVFYAFMIISEGMYEFWVMIARGLRKITVFAIGNIIYILAMALSSVLLVKVLNGGLYGLMVSYMIGYLVSALFMFFACRTYQYIDFKAVNKTTYMEMVRYAIHMLPNAIAWWIINVSDRTIVTFFLGPELNAVLAVTNKLPNLCQQIFSKFHLSWQETAVDSVNAEDRDGYYSKIMNNLFTVMVSIVVMVISLNFVYFQFLFTEEYHYGYYLCPILMLAILIYMMTQFLGGIYIARMESKKNGTTTMIAAAVNLVIDLVLIHFIEIWAAVLSTFVAYLLLFIIRYVDITKDIKLTFKKESLYYILVLLYFVAMCYVNFMPINIINVMLAAVFCVVINKSLLVKAFRMIAGKLKK